MRSEHFEAVAGWFALMAVLCIGAAGFLSGANHFGKVSATLPITAGLCGVAWAILAGATYVQAAARAWIERQTQ